MRSYEFIQEIERAEDHDYPGGKDQLNFGSKRKNYRKLPGGSEFLYTIERGEYETAIKIWDPTADVTSEPEPVRQRFEDPDDYDQRYDSWQKKKLGGPTVVALLTVEHNIDFPMSNAVQVDTITVHEDYRGRGLAKALYGIVLTIMRKTLVAGHRQTPGGRKNWVSLSQIPGVKLKGYVVINEYDLLGDTPYSVPEQKAKQIINSMMTRLGGQYIGQDQDRDHYFSFDVKPTTSGEELEAYVKQQLTQVYDQDGDITTGLYAVWKK